MGDSFKQEKLDMVCFSDSMEYFVFEGPEFIEKDKRSKDKKANKQEKQKVKDKKGQKVFYVFKLEFERSKISKEAGWKFIQ